MNRLPDPTRPLAKVLISFHYMKRFGVPIINRLARGQAMLFADCGAYSAKKQGFKIDVHEYARWLRAHDGSFTVYPNLDVFADIPQSDANLHALESYGLAPIPVFHAGEPWSWYEQMCERYPYVALGNLTGRYSPAEAHDWKIRAHEIAAAHGVLLHGFGMTRWDNLVELPWYSVDSSSWQGHRRGDLQMWDERNKRIVKMTAGDLHPMARAWAPQHGVTVEEISRPRLHRLTLVTCNVHAWVQAEQYLRRVHGPVASQRDPSRRPGLHIYLVDASSNMVRDCVRAQVVARGRLG